MDLVYALWFKASEVGQNIWEFAQLKDKDDPHLFIWNTLPHQPSLWLSGKESAGQHRWSVMPSNHLILCCPLLLLLQSFPASGSYSMSQYFASGGQRIGVSASASVLPMNIQVWLPLGWTGWTSCSPRDSQESSPTPQFKSTNSLVLSFLYSHEIKRCFSLEEKLQPI